jgi:hypothetical protein
VTRPEISGSEQVRVLVHVFLARFFEHEATAGPTDLRESFFWLVAALAAPGLLFAFHQQFYWNLVALGPGGAAKLRMYVLFDKTLYLTLTFVAMGAVTTAVWNALIVDRRDAFILGALPVRPRVVVVAKLLSLAAYVAALNLGMHAGAALLFGDFLGSAHGGEALIRAVAAHFVAASASGMFVFLSVIALVSACLAILGPRHFARTAAVLQVLLVAVISTTLLMTVTVAHGAISLAEVAAPPAWLTHLPPIWFLGVYETIAGTSVDAMRELAGTGVVAFVSAMVAVAIFYPIACWRVLATAVTVGTPATNPWTRRTSPTMVSLLATDPATRAALQFLAATAGRVGRFRLVMAAAIGLGLNVLAAIVLHWIAEDAAGKPSVSLLAAPLVLIVALVTGWRVIVAMPSELSARWVFRCIPVEGFAGRAAARRFMFTFGVMVPVALAATVWLALWGIATAWQFVVNTLFVGGILVEAQLWGFAGMPCTRPVAISDSNLQARWPFYAIGLFACALGVPVLEVWAAGHWTEWLLTIGLAAAYSISRTLSAEAARVTVLTDHQRGPILLDLPLLPARREPSPADRVTRINTVQRGIPHA